MKNKLSKQQQKQKANSFFKLIKALPPFTSPQTFYSLDNQPTSHSGSKQPLLILSSRVYQMNVKANKPQKRVTFVEQQPTTGKHKQLGKNRPSSSLKQSAASLQHQKYSKDENPEQICRDLLNLQKNVYQTFKIKQDRPVTTTQRSAYTEQSSTTNSLPINHSQSIQPSSPHRNLSLMLESRIKQGNTSSRVQLSKCQSERAVQSNAKPTHQQYKKKRQQIDNVMPSKSLSARHTMFQRPNNQQDSFSGVSKRSKHEGQPNQNGSSQGANRSQVFWKQQNSLMVQIFRKKLEGRFNLPSSKYY